MDTNEFWQNLSSVIDAVYQQNPSFRDHRKNYPWLVGSLGDPTAAVMFVAENPSLGQVEKATNPDGGPPTAEAQWFASKGDGLFRQALIQFGFKSGSVHSSGDWHCYITNVIKEADYAEKWKKRNRELHEQAAEAWAPVLAWEIETVRPRIVVAMGKKVLDHLKRLRKNGLIHLPQLMHIHHYSYIAHRPDGRRGPMHPERVEAYLSSVEDVRDQLMLATHGGVRSVPGSLNRGRLRKFGS